VRARVRACGAALVGCGAATEALTLLCFATAAGWTGLNQPPASATAAATAAADVAPTDSTLRPDVREMEDGEMVIAADEKRRLEEVRPHPR
jgi:hypothetical protein